MLLLAFRPKIKNNHFGRPECSLCQGRVRKKLQTRYLVAFCKTQQLRFGVFREGVFQKMPALEGQFLKKNSVRFAGENHLRTQKNTKQKLCAEVPERPLPKDPFFQLLKKRLATARGPKNRCCNSVWFWHLWTIHSFSSPQMEAMDANRGNIWNRHVPTKHSSGNIWAWAPKTPTLNDKLPKLASASQRQTIFNNTYFGTVPKPPHNYLGKCLWKLPAPTHLRNTADKPLATMGPVLYPWKGPILYPEKPKMYGQFALPSARTYFSVLYMYLFNIYIYIYLHIHIQGVALRGAPTTRNRNSRVQKMPIFVAFLDNFLARLGANPRPNAQESQQRSLLILFSFLFLNFFLFFVIVVLLF